MPGGDERETLRPNAAGLAKLLSGLTEMIRGEEKDEAERARWLQTIPDDALRELSTISAEAASTEKLLLKLKEVMPTLTDFFASEGQLDEFMQEFEAAMDGVERELQARLQKVNDINAGLK